MIPYEHQAQYYETDGMGIVHHSNFIRWFEEARVDLLDQLGLGYDVFEANGFSSPVLGICCNYKNMVRFHETVCITASIREYTGVKLVVGYEIRNKKTQILCCDGESKHCFLHTGETPVSLKKAWPDAHEILLGAKLSK